jgi:dihydropteroate synthase
MNNRNQRRGELIIHGRSFVWGQRTYIMGILNITFDSFSGDGLGLDLDKTVAQALEFVKAGADILDIGGESTNPYHSQLLSTEEELQRVLPVLKAVSAVTDVPLSIDSYKPEVARIALENGAHIINDIHGLENPAMLALAAETSVPVIAMHMRGTPQTMQKLTDYGGDVKGVLLDYFRQRLEVMTKAGLRPENIILDPGFGFAKTYEQNLELLGGLSLFRELGQPLLVGVSRKGFIGRAMAGPEQEPYPPASRTYGTAAAITVAIAQGADIVRVHDVAEMVPAVRMADALTRKRELL